MRSVGAIAAALEFSIAALLIQTKGHRHGHASHRPAITGSNALATVAPIDPLREHLSIRAIATAAD